jgi:alpha,alpha-trehalose phosphorylase
VYETHPRPYAEAGFGYPESGQSVINVTNGKLTRLSVDDELFDVRTGVLRSHRMTLDFRTGELRRELEWESPVGRAIKLISSRIVSFTQRSVAAVNYEVEVLGVPTRVVLQSELIANEPLPPQTADPRGSWGLTDVLVGTLGRSDGLWVALTHITRGSGLTVAAVMDHIVAGPEGTGRVRRARQIWGD